MLIAGMKFVILAAFFFFCLLYSVFNTAGLHCEDLFRFARVNEQLVVRRSGDLRHK